MSRPSCRRGSNIETNVFGSAVFDSRDYITVAGPSHHPIVSPSTSHIVFAIRSELMPARVRKQKNPTYLFYQCFDNLLAGCVFIRSEDGRGREWVLHRAPLATPHPDSSSMYPSTSLQKRGWSIVLRIWAIRVKPRSTSPSSPF